MKYAGIIKAKELLDCVEHQFFLFLLPVAIRSNIY